MASAQTSSSTAQSVAENIRETLESIVVAFILAFVFRAFIVEAFVIPTGSMAVTLYGQQITQTCSVCGFEYALGVQQPLPRDTNYERLALQLCCPNCGAQADDVKGLQLLRPDSGDRILVHKWPLDLPGEQFQPRRWDVTVFKDPHDGLTNYIKRLVGLPGEVLEIIDGDVYAASLDRIEAEAPHLIEQLNELRRDVYRFGHPESGVFDSALRHSINARYHEINKELLPFLRIQRKAPVAQESLWFNVYNHDYLPNYESLGDSGSRFRPRWEPVGVEAEGAWSTRQREITFSSDEPEWSTLQFSGKPITDFYAYNILTNSKHQPSHVGDMRLRFTWFPQAGEGGLLIRMDRDRNQFSARIDLDGSLKLGAVLPHFERPATRVEIEGKVPAFRLNEAVSIDFSQVDFSLSLKIDGEEVLASKPDQLHPTVDQLMYMLGIPPFRLPPEGGGSVVDDRAGISLAARDMTCAIRHLVLERDVYYVSQEIEEEAGPAPPRPGQAIAGNDEREKNPYYKWSGWGTQGRPIMLRRELVVDGRSYGGEYFMLGDNSPASKDSRLWWQIGAHLEDLGDDYQLGTVPGDQLIGKAFFVYWPAGYPLRFAGNIGLIPNFGKMRWIR